MDFGLTGEHLGEHLGKHRRHQHDVYRHASLGAAYVKLQ